MDVTVGLVGPGRSAESLARASPAGGARPAGYVDLSLEGDEVADVVVGGALPVRLRGRAW